MVSPAKRSRSVKKIKKRTPGGRTVTHYRGGKARKASCGRCAGLLDGSPERLYGGVLCSGCLTELLRYVTRFEAKYGVEGFEDLPIARDLTLEKFLPRGWLTAIEEKKFKQLAVKPRRSAERKAKPKGELPERKKPAKKEKPPKKEKPAKKPEEAEAEKPGKQPEEVKEEKPAAKQEPAKDEKPAPKAKAKKAKSKKAAEK